MANNMRLGGGGRFAALESKLAGRPGVTNPAGLAAAIGRRTQVIAAIIVMAFCWMLSIALVITEMRRQERAHARREDLLVNQVMHAAGLTWQAPPSEERYQTPDPTEDPGRFITRPELLPDT